MNVKKRKMESIKFPPANNLYYTVFRGSHLEIFVCGAIF